MPELPDVELYVSCLKARLIGQPFVAARVTSPFVLRSVQPTLPSLVGLKVESVERLGKRIVLGFDSGLFIAIHLMIAGRLRWLEPPAKAPAKITLCTFRFPNGTLALTEASSKKRASVHVVADRSSLAQFDRRGLEVIGASPEALQKPSLARAGPSSGH